MISFARAGLCLFALAGLTAGLLRAACAQPAPAGAPTLTINEYTVTGNHLLTELEVDTAVYPYLGSGQTVQSVDRARRPAKSLCR